MPPKKGGKGYRDPRSIEQQLTEEDPNHQFQDEVDRLLVKHWNADEPAKCLRWDLGKKCIFQVAAPGQDKLPEKEKDQYLVFVRLIDNMNRRPTYLDRFCKEADVEQRNMNYVDHLDSMGVECGSYVSPGLIKTAKMQIAVNKMCKGETLTPSLCLEQEAIGAIGSYLAQMHNASRTYKAKSPKEIAKVEETQDACKSSCVPKDSLHYGIVHSDFHTGNYLLRKVQDSLQEKSTDTEESKEVSSDEGTTPAKYEVAAYDFDDIKTGWFVTDIERVICDIVRKLEQVPNKWGEQLLRAKQDVVNWLCQGYSEQMHKFGWSKFQVNRDHLVAFTSKYISKEIIHSGAEHAKARIAENKYLERMKMVRQQRQK